VNEDRTGRTIAARRTAWMTLIVLLVIAIGPELDPKAFAVPSVILLALVSALRPSDPGRSLPLLRGPGR
jgi:hypothetical protein